MRGWICGLVLAALPATATAQEECYSGPFGPYGASQPAWLLVMQRPEVKETFLQGEPVLLKKGLVLARQEYASRPQRRYLASGVNLTDDKGQPLAKAVPLQAGAPITTWRGADGDRHCSIGWMNGLFGGVTGDGHYRWICFEDRDGDGRFENAWRPWSKNMGLSYNRRDMPVTPPVALSDAPPAGVVADARGVPDSFPMYRRIEVASLSGTKLKLRYWGAGVRAEDVELKIGEPATVKLGGVTVTLARNARGMWTLAASGAFDAAEITPVCGGATYRVGTFDRRVSFPFPNW